MSTNMADSGNNTDGSGGGWWGNLLAAAKEQTGKVYEMVSHDLTEFTSTMQNDTKQAVEKTKETLKTSTQTTENLNTTDRVKQGFHSFMSGITNMLTVDPEDTSPPSQPVSQPGTGIFDRAKARLRAIQVDTGTYLQEPSGPPEKYAEWLKSFDLDAQKGDISDLLVTMVEVRSLYTSLVPSQVSHQDFWRRYFYKVHQLHMDEERKKALMKRAERADVKEDSISWDDEESGGEEDAPPSKKSPQSTKTEKPDSRLQTPDGEESKAEKVADTEQAKPVDITSKTEQNVTNKINEETPSSARLKLGAEENIKDEGTKNKDTPLAEGNIKSSFQEVNEKGKVAKESNNVNVEICDKLDEQEGPAISQDSTGVQELTKNDKNEGPEQSTGKLETIESEQKHESESCDRVTEEDNGNENELKTKVKGDMVVVGERISPSSDSSGNKDSINDDWEQDFDVDVTPEDLAAASELAQKMNISAADYNKLTGGEDDDWENWD